MDVTDAFEDVGHSKEARSLMEKYYIADLATESLEETAVLDKVIMSESLMDHCVSFIPSYDISL
jgi:cytochrome b involved in lipid metabolism